MFTNSRDYRAFFDTTRFPMLISGGAVLLVKSGSGVHVTAAEV